MLCTALSGGDWVERLFSSQFAIFPKFGTAHLTLDTEKIYWGHSSLKTHSFFSMIK